MQNIGAKQRRKPNDYPRFTFRLPMSYLRRLWRVAKVAGLSVGSIIVAALSNHLPVLEHKYGLVKPQESEE